MLAEDGKWSCPKCGEVLSFIGPATRKRVIDDHMYWRHDRPEREARKREQERADLLANKDVDVIPFDEAFYDGARLSQQDLSFLWAVRVRWEDTP